MGNKMNDAELHRKSDELTHEIEESISEETNGIVKLDIGNNIEKKISQKVYETLKEVVKAEREDNEIKIEDHHETVWGLGP